MNGLIYTLTGVPKTGCCRCMGYFYSFQELLDKINKNGINGLDEGGLFKYLVVEKFEAGLYASSIGAEKWFRADYSKNTWKEVQKPLQFKGITNYAMG